MTLKCDSKFDISYIVLSFLLCSFPSCLSLFPSFLPFFSSICHSCVHSFVFWTSGALTQAPDTENELLCISEWTHHHSIPYRGVNYACKYMISVYKRAQSVIASCGIQHCFILAVLPISLNYPHYVSVYNNKSRLVLR